MKKSLLLCSIVLLTITPLASSALAKDKIILPTTAVLLDAAGVMATYDGKQFAWAHPNTDKVTGTAKFDLKNGLADGTWKAGKDTGEWESKVTFKGDQYCFEARGKGQKKYNKMVCNLVYLDGTTTYEIDPKSKRVLSIDTPM